MPRPTNHEENAAARGHPAWIDHSQYHRHGTTSFPRAFPIRTSQSHQRNPLLANSLYPSQSEHHLRRKTPSGTIEAAYDGSPVRPNPGPPPLKQMIVSANSSLDPRMPEVATAAASQHTWFSGSHNFSQSYAGSSRGPWFPYTEPWGQYQPHHGGAGALYSQQPHSYVSPNSFTSLYQPVVRANEYNVRAFCPPPVPTSEMLHLGHLDWQPGPVAWGQQWPGQGPNVFTHSATPGAALGHIEGYFSGQPPPLYDHTSSLEYRYQSGPSSHIKLESLTLNSEVSSPVILADAPPTALPGFRDKALAHAHKAYLDLLRYMQSSRKPQPSRPGDDSCLPSKPVVYPKPPNPASSLVTGHSKWGQHDKPANATNSTSSLGQMPQPGQGNHSLGLLGQYLDSSMNPSQPACGLYGPNHHSSQTTGPPFGPTLADSVLGLCSPDQISPVAKAKTSLHLLHTICEESGWKWVDGMMLGGCLYYGLEDYDTALKWFMRVIAMEADHVVAITDVAATLYCLERPEEAEQHWLRAVKLSPDYLEASEHLVGLFYKKRSREAIDIINYVQQALRLPARVNQSISQLAPLTDIIPTYDSHRDGSGSLTHKPKGFGSSGYALPGSENGRILALVHAKGTMLYNLKETKHAAEAFEEAVLISIGRRADGIHNVVRRIQMAFTADGQSSAATASPPQILLLPPEKARQTARLIFSGGGELPGLSFVANGAPKRAANQTTSNSLLSLAKIFQDALSCGASGSSIRPRPSGVGDILALYYLSLSLQESPSTANNVGILLAGVQQAAPQFPRASDASSHPSIPGVPSGSGLALALAYYQYGLRLDPKHVHLHTNLGSLLKDIGQLDLAIQMYEQAVSCDGTFDIALTNLANAVKDRGRISDAIAYYRRAVKSNPDFAEAVCGLQTALNSVCDWRGRGGVLLEAGRYDRWHVDKDGALVDVQVCRRSSGLTQRVVGIVSRQLTEASQWGLNVLHDELIHIIAHQLSNSCDVDADILRSGMQRWRGSAWEGSRLLRLMERAVRVMLRKWYCDPALTEASRRRYIRPQLPSHLTAPSAPTVLPFHTFTCPLGPRDIRAISQRNALRISCTTLKAPWISNIVYPPPSPPNPHLNIGYVSSDFNNHPLAHLMQSVFGLHNPDKARAVCYATTASDKSAYRLKIEREAPLFRDVSSWSPDRFIQQIVSDNIHILVNLNGYTRGARNEIFAARPAPIQMSFMGFAGTLGAEWCDYILADTTAIPPDTLRPYRSNMYVEDVFRDETEGATDDWVYSENIIFCRETFFCCDHAQSSDMNERQIDWEQELSRRWRMRKELFPSLPDDAIILGNFNQLYKIEPTIFRSWLRILSQVPKAVLWLLRFPELGEANLRTTAKMWAGPEVASRIVFTDVAPKNQHISRARVCDLFLDTPECNAHTTAADVLWSSTPLLTYPRYPFKMCSRMAASILKGALPHSSEGRQAASELIVWSETEYEQAATALAGGLSYHMDTSYGRGVGRLADLRRLLFESKWTCALFNTRRWVDDVERAYQEAWRKWTVGEAGDIYL